MLLSYTQQLDEKLGVMKNTNSDLQASVATAETVKEFLAKRVTALEQACGELNAKADAAAQKTVSDQQVISFLDEKTRDVERERDAALAELVEMKQSLARPGGALRERVIAGTMSASDSATESSQAAGVEEAQWVRERKLLVTEVRRLRMLLNSR
jgi:ABC-type transporter Mla subunit MlaD